MGEYFDEIKQAYYENKNLRINRILNSIVNDLIEQSKYNEELVCYKVIAFKEDYQELKRLLKSEGIKTRLCMFSCDYVICAWVCSKTLEKENSKKISLSKKQK